uniref:Uncharacterized protein n=1 Tax=viral metagenome TaxID=1070528 RepID=A0A6C0I9T7_9ZZZZ
MNYISPVGYVDLDNSCNYSLDVKTTPSREAVDPNIDLAFYFKTYIEPVYGLGNINVMNCAAFMKDLEMNWSKLDNDLKDKVLKIMVDYIFKSGDYNFKNELLKKLEIPVSVPHKVVEKEPKMESKSSFGSTGSNNMIWYVLLVILTLVFLFLIFKK